MNEPVDLPTLFERAMLLSSGERAAFLSQACAGRPDLRAEIESLIAAADPLRDDDHYSEPDLFLGRRIAGFTLERLIGEGGHGRVYLAHQHSPQRAVALKIMSSGLLSRSARRRFEYESEVLARLRHPGIAHVYEAGVESIAGVLLPWFAMEYIEGAQTIVEFARETTAPLRARVALAIELCDVLQYGHQRGVLHRDLKPSNVLIGQDARLKVIDFGVAGSLGSNALPVTHATHAGDILGTIAYMSPEQCSGDHRVPDARSDTYALGTVIYELLTLAPAFDVRSKSIPDAIQLVVGASPRRASMVNPSLRGDLEAILMKSLEREPERRYQTAAELALDLRAYLSSGTVSARHHTLRYRATRFLCRRWLPVSVGAAFVVALSAAAVVSYVSLLGEREARVAVALRAEELSRALTRAEDEVRVRIATTTFLSRNVVNAIPARTGKPDATVRESLVLAVKQIAEVARGDARAELELRRISAAALQGMNELRAAAEQYGGAVRIVDANPNVQLLAPVKWVGLLGSYGLVLTAIKDDRGGEVQLRAWEEGKSLLGERHKETVFAGAKYFSGAVKRDGFEQHRVAYLSHYTLACEALGVDDPATQPLRQGVARNLANGSKEDRTQARGLVELELASAARGGKPLAIENARSLQLEFFVASGDQAAVALGRELATAGEQSYSATSMQALTRRALLIRALRHAGLWGEALLIARAQAEAQDHAQTAQAIDRAEAWLDVAVASAEVGDAVGAEISLATAIALLADLPPESARAQVTRLEVIRARARLDVGGDASLQYAALSEARNAITVRRPMTVAALRESMAVLAQLAVRAGRLQDATRYAQEYLDALDGNGIQHGALSEEMRAILELPR